MRTLEWRNSTLVLVDQSALPSELRWIECREYAEVADAIRKLRVRGAPAIGVAAAYGIVLAAQASGGKTREEVATDVRDAANCLVATRPTAVNLAWAVQRMVSVVDGVTGGPDDVRQALIAAANRMAEEDEARNRQMGRWGANLVPDGANVLTHCNAGALATVAYGTALGVVRAAVEQGKRIHVYADETRPVLQGARLTAWELSKDEIPVTLIADNMAGYLMSLGKVDLVIVGADRIAANGDVANKIGTYGLSVLAKAHGIPFYVAAPTSTVDLSVPNGAAIPIEERSAREITHWGDVQLAPNGVNVFNPAFDVTPHENVRAIVTEMGIANPPFDDALRAMVMGSGS